MIKKVLFSLIFSLLALIPAQASHLMGGEITWDCQPNGQFVFTMKLYRDCNGIAGPTTAALDVHNHPTLTSIPLTLITTVDISPTGPGCNTCVTQGVGTTQEFIFRSNPITISGVPPVGTGWVFTFDSCCRNAAISNLTAPGGAGFTLRAIMYRYNAQNTNPCYDSSPNFAERPAVVMCTRNPFTYNHNATDKELDSLVYDWGRPLDDFTGAYTASNPTALPFSGAYTYLSPLPGPAQNPANVAATMNPNNGVVSFTSFTAGSFVTVTRVRAYKCGQLVSEIYREIQVTLVGNCIISPGVYNSPPVVTAPFQHPVTGLYTLYADTVFAGDTVNFFMSATDFEFLPAAVGGGPQTLTITATGQQFGLGFTNPNVGCPYPPCATLSPAVPISALFGAGVTFNWVTSCNHLPKNVGCVNLSSTYQFVIKVTDNFCPAPAINFNTISVTVLSPPPVKKPDIRTLSVQANGDVLIDWAAFPSTVGAPVDTNKYFKSVIIQTALAAAGPWTTVDSVVNINTLSFLHVGANAHLFTRYYRFFTHSGCDRYSDTTAVFQTMYLNVANPGPGPATLSWNPIINPNLPTACASYTIYMENPLGTWTQVATVPNNINTIVIPINVCNNQINFSVVLCDAHGTFSVSNIAGSLFFQPAPVISPPSLRCLAVQPSGNVVVTWVTPPDTGSYFSKYQVFHSANTAGPFTLLTNITNYATTSYTHVGAGANAASQYYYTITEAGCNSSSLMFSITSDTLASIKLNVAASLGFADLSWNALRTPNIATTMLPYRVYRRIAPAAWVQIGTTNNLTYRDTIRICNVTYDYKIEINDASGCTSVSSIASGLFTWLGDIITAPSLRCVAVQTNGDVILNWITPPDPTNFFAAYQIYHSLAPGGPFALLTTVNVYATSTYTHVGANANNQVNYYYMNSLSGCTGLLTSVGNSNTLASMRLTVAPVLGFANLSWNALSTPLPATSALPYTVFRRIAPAAWTQIGTSATTTYQDTIRICNVPYEYKVELTDASGCTSVSSVASGLFTWMGDILAAPSLRCVSVLTNGNVTLNWVNPADPTNFFAAYEIYHSTAAGGPFALLATINTYATSTYTHVGANGNVQVNYYYIKTLSGCTGIVTSATNSATLSNMVLTATPVMGFANLSWNALSTPIQPTSTLPYRVYRRIAPAAWVQIGTSATTTYQDTIRVCNVPYEYKIELSDASGCISTSSVSANVFTWIGDVLAAPSLRCVSVLTNGNVTLNWVNPADPTNFFAAYEIYQSTAAGGPFALLTTINTYATSTYTHVGANGNVQVNYYYIKTLSGCTGLVTSATNSATLSNMVLTATPVMGFANLSWNALSTPIQPTSTLPYRVYRRIAPAAWVQIGTSATTTYQDTIRTCNVPYEYKIELSDASGCISTSSVSANVFTYPGDIVAAPSLRCVSVLVNGDVSLNWVTPADPTNFFAAYEVYHSTAAGGPFALLTTINTYATAGFTHVGANANAQINYYYLKTLSGCTGLVPSATNSTTLASMLLTASPALGFANLTWNALATPLPATSTLPYRVYRRIAPAAWAQIATTNNTTYQDVITTCNVPYEYKIEISDASGCISTSSIDNDIFTWVGDIVDAPSLRCVSVLNNGDVQLNWIAPANPTNFFAAYEVYQSTALGGPFNLLTTINTYATTSYTHAGANANNQVNYYYVKTLSGCSGLVPSAVNSDILASIKLDAVPSLGFATLSWNALATPLPATSLPPYKVFRNINAAGWVQIATTSALTYVDPIVQCNIPIQYRVEISDASGCTSVSSVDSDVFTYMGDVLDAPSLRCVSVLPSGDVQINWVLPTDPNNFFAAYEVYQSNGGAYNLITTINTYATSSFTHVGANANTQVNTYYLKTLSGCTGIAFNTTSDTLSSILLSATPSLGFANLSWNAVHTPLLASSASDYTVYRNINGAGWTQIATTPNLSYVDLIDQCNIPIAYRVEIADASGCTSVSSVPNGVFTYLGDVLDAPSLRCVSVQANGDVDLTWVIPTDPTNFFGSYEIYSSSGGAYSLLSTIGAYGQASFTHVGANANNVVNRYYLRTLSGCTAQVPSVLNSDTLASIKVVVTNNVGIANINWNSLANPLPGTSSGSYRVYKEYPAGIWSQIALTPGNVHRDTITVCSANINYKVEIDDNLGCTSVSSIDGDLFQDIMPPNTPQIDTVSVDPMTGLASISWNVNNSGDTQGYTIYQFNGASWDSLATVYGIGNINYFNANSLAGSQTESYAIAAFDSCGNISVLSPTHRTIFLNSSIDICKQATALTWNSYINMGGGVQQNLIWASENGGPFQVVGSTPGTATSYEHTGLLPMATYCYYVQAAGSVPTRTSSSNLTCVVADIPIDPQFNYLKRATVGGKDLALIESYLDTLADVRGYKILRSRTFNGTYDTIAFVSPPQAGDILSYVDQSARVSAASFFYKIVVVDSCGNNKYVSNIGRTIHLTANPNENLTNQLSWNDYGDWDGGILEYNIYRKTNEYWEPGPIATVPYGTRAYLDDVSEYYRSDATFCYYVEAIEDQGNIWGFRDTSTSNDICVIQPAKLYVPNAFTPGGYNPIFYPIDIFIDVNSYLFAVYNRWGEKIFETNNPTEGWNGSIANQEAPEGAYVYLVKFVASDGKEFVKRGTVTLIR